MDDRNRNVLNKYAEPSASRTRFKRAAVPWRDYQCILDGALAQTNRQISVFVDCVPYDNTHRFIVSQTEMNISDNLVVPRGGFLSIHFRQIERVHGRTSATLNRGGSEKKNVATRPFFFFLLSVFFFFYYYCAATTVFYSTFSPYF